MKRNKLNSVWKEYCFILQEEFEDTKGLSESVYRKRKRTKGQATIYKTYT